MPVYEYQCKACHKEFEYQQRMSDPDKTECEACGGALERLISRTAFTLKGSGWYKDLYSSAKPEAAKGVDAKADSSSSSDSSSASSSDSSGTSGSSGGSSSGGTSGGSSGGTSGGSSSGGTSSSGGGSSTSAAAARAT